ncbi:phospholipid carrier-dependent glycosyltransferase [Sphingomonas sp. So64.6b]|uniref:glycosyltransferase family 39 protein n=1 Tax=Sphingomonas sp. So64.6b TaxID=2997354 RepID=UPI0016026B9B|nr:phospholipid carrier-dependent glycosyltransferase [Sphingomonas sp. So64.6b]QNA85998.1 phospholipid carrier-dependent glycosyltransferase [Sphingomonas sp. So64.6b]
MRPHSNSVRIWLAAMALVFVMLALARPLDHDESQYVAAAVLTAHGYLPYRDFAYLQVPLQPILFAPLAWAFGDWAWPGLRLVNALLGAAAVAFVYRAARDGGAEPCPALLGAGLFACTDILLFSIGTARNDALPVALLAAALPLVIRAANDRGTRWTALLAGLLLAGAGAAKISYALPAVAYGLYALLDRGHRPLWVALGALPVALFVAISTTWNPHGFWFGVFAFPALAPGEYYRTIDRPWKMSWLAKPIDTLKFLALGPALIGLLLTSRVRWRARSGRAIDWMLWAGIIAALAPFPTWRQYLLPILPPLFVRLAIGWQASPPGRRTRIALVVFVCAGLAPSVEALVRAIPGVPMVEAMRQGAAIRSALDAGGVNGPVATLSPQFLPATGRLPDPRFATGPFYFRSHKLLNANAEAVDRVIARDTLGIHFAGHFPQSPAAILVGGEGNWTSGDPALDEVLEDWAKRNGWRPVPVAGGRFRLYVRPL